MAALELMVEKAGDLNQRVWVVLIGGSGLELKRVARC